MVQEEIKRRGESKNGRHSSVSIFASKLICGDCGSYYGQKVWHSTDKYRKLIYRCNQKFSKKNKCYTPTLCEEDIKKAFIQSLNQLDNDYVVDDLLKLIEEAKDTSKIDKEISKTKAELDAVIELATKMVNENASTALDQEEYQKKYKILVDESDEYMNAINHLENQKKNRMVMIGRANLLIETIQNKKEAFRSFDERLWSLLVEKAIVNRDGSLKFIYYAGYENIVKL